MKRVSCYVTTINIKDGPVGHHRPFIESSYLNTNSSFDGWSFNLSTEIMIPKEWLSFMLCSDVKLNTLTKDEDDCFYDLGQYIITDKLIAFRVRQFITASIINLNKGISYKGFVLADLEF